MPRIFSEDELIIDDSFINYCNRANAKDTMDWENYLLQNPAEAATVEEAKAFICALKIMLRAEEKQQSMKHFIELLHAKKTTDNLVNEQGHSFIKMDLHPVKIRKTYWWLAAASVAFLAILSIWILKGNNTIQTVVTSKEHTIVGDNKTTVLSSNQIIKTGAALNKIFFLPDGTKVTMNANTVISVDSGFGRTKRLVTLDGEAFFDVTHDANSPFIVRLKNFDVKVLGTMFNVKSYPGEKTSEATLVKGKVEISLKSRPGKKVFLKPNQKVVLYNPQLEVLPTVKHPPVDVKAPITLVVIKPLSISSDGISIIETGWMRNRLEINDETFSELKGKLERKYDVKISFSDEQVMRYKFTALFENESIDQVLKALQLSYSFKYTISKNQVTISK